MFQLAYLGKGYNSLKKVKGYVFEGTYIEEFNMSKMQVRLNANWNGLDMAVLKQLRRLSVSSFHILLVLDIYSHTITNTDSTPNNRVTVRNPAINSIVQYFIHRHLSGDEANNLQNGQSEILDSHSDNLVLNASDIFSCASVPTWRDLGDLKYPRIVRENLCIPGPCFLGYSTCESVFHNISVLTVRNPLVHAEDQAVPTALRARWRFETVLVSVACRCASGQ